METWKVCDQWGDMTIDIPRAHISLLIKASRLITIIPSSWGAHGSDIWPHMHRSIYHRIKGLGKKYWLKVEIEQLHQVAWPFHCFHHWHGSTIYGYPNTPPSSRWKDNIFCHPVDTSIRDVTLNDIHSLTTSKAELLYIMTSRTHSAVGYVITA